jgi:Xaa-Pro aminopeptidase
VVAVGGKPTDAQLEAWQHILPVFQMVEQQVKPGRSCVELFREVHAWLNSKRWEFEHHLGHGIGLFPHEAPHLSPAWDDTFQEGEVFAVEPGLYGDDLRAGIRLENNYLVTATAERNSSPACRSGLSGRRATDADSRRQPGANRTPAKAIRARHPSLS